MPEPADVSERDRALGTIAALARQHRLTVAEIAAAVGAPAEGGVQRGRARAVLVRVLGVLGGTFVFAGVAAFIALQWEVLGSAARVVVTLGSGAAAFTLAVVGTHDQRYDKVAVPLFVVAAVLEPTGMIVAFDEFGSGGDWRLASLAASVTMALQYALTFRTIRRSTLLFLTLAFAALAWWTAFDLLDADSGVTALVLGGSLLLAAAGIDRTSHRDITPFWYLVGSLAFLAGLFDVVERTPFELLFLAVAAAFVYLSVVVHSRTLLAVATLAVLAYTAWYTGEYFADSFGWPLALIAFGIFMIGLGALAFRIDREYVSEPPSPTQPLGH